MPKGKYKKVVGLIKYEWSEKIMTKFFELRAKPYNFLIDHVSEVKKAKAKKILS